MAVDETSESTDSSISYQAPSILQETGWEIFTIRAEEDRSWKTFGFVIYVWCSLSFIFLSYFVRISVLSRVGTTFPHGSLVAPLYFTFCTHYYCTWYLFAGVCMLCLSYPAVCVFFTLNRSSTSLHPAHVSILARARSFISSFSFILFVSFFFRRSLSMCLGCWRVYVVLVVPSTMAWQCVV